MGLAVQALTVVATVAFLLVICLAIFGAAVIVEMVRWWRER